ncbi:helix-turn-helix domain-containing protein [Allosphingosinicella sp.]|uniref:helix-turn-helix domain-containing protein n=1 Tax=Allosphingosinicella sp. TaxID=2823234 RepID=UPI002FC11EE5
MNELYGAFAASKPDAASLGRRAAELRTQLERTAEDVARQVGVPVSELLRFEHTGEASVELLMGLLEALTPGGDLDHAFETPRFASIKEVIAYEQRRMARR